MLTLLPSIDSHGRAPLIAGTGWDLGVGVGDVVQEGVFVPEMREVLGAGLLGIRRSGARFLLRARGP